MTKFIAIDIETGGLDPSIHPITEVGLVYEKELGGGIQEVEFSLPFDPDACSPKALEIQKYGQREYPPQWTHSYAAEFLYTTLRDAHLIGKNPWFDAGFVEQFLRDWGFPPTWHHRLIDVGSLAWGFTNGVRQGIGGYIKEPPNSATVGNIMGMPIEEVERHAALYDAKWAWDIFREVVPR